MSYGQLTGRADMNACNPVAVGDVEQAIVRMRDRIEALHNIIENAEGRFNSVLRIEPPRKGEDVQKDPPTMTPLATELQRLAQGIEHANARLMTFIERCGL